MGAGPSRVCCTPLCKQARWGTPPTLTAPRRASCASPCLLPTPPGTNASRRSCLSPSRSAVSTRCCPRWRRAWRMRPHRGRCARGDVRARRLMRTAYVGDVGSLDFFDRSKKRATAHTRVALTRDPCRPAACCAPRPCRDPDRPSNTAGAALDPLTCNAHVRRCMHALAMWGGPRRGAQSAGPRRHGAAPRSAGGGGAGGPANSGALFGCARGVLLRQHAGAHDAISGRPRDPAPRGLALPPVPRSRATMIARARLAALVAIRAPGAAAAGARRLAGGTPEGGGPLNEGQGAAKPDEELYGRPDRQEMPSPAATLTQEAAEEAGEVAARRRARPAPPRAARPRRAHPPPRLLRRHGEGGGAAGRPRRLPPRQRPLRRRRQRRAARPGRAAAGARGAGDAAAPRPLGCQRACGTPGGPAPASRPSPPLTIPSTTHTHRTSRWAPRPRARTPSTPAPSPPRRAAGARPAATRAQCDGPGPARGRG
jgi:hypothetical protein